jgi:hypothetical protein
VVLVKKTWYCFSADYLKNLTETVRFFLSVRIIG